MTVKEKLVDLLRKAIAARKKKETKSDLERVWFLAEFLIDNGVTVQDRLEEKQATSDKTSEWISVKDRLPTKEDADEINCILAANKKFGWSGCCFSDFVSDNPTCFTHWMPLPEPPKGD